METYLFSNPSNVVLDQRLDLLNQLWKHADQKIDYIEIIRQKNMSFTHIFFAARIGLGVKFDFEPKHTISLALFVIIPSSTTNSIFLFVIVSLWSLVVL